MENILCSLKGIKDGLSKLINILNHENLRSRNINSSEVDILVNLLREISELIKKENVKDYSDLIFLLNTTKIDSKYKQIIYRKSFLIEAISILSIRSRKEELRQYIENSLDRTNTNFEDSIFKNIKNKFFNEFIESLTIYYSLKSIEFIRNSVANIRFNIGNRTIEEYFAELISGWILEEYLLLKIEEVIGKNHIKKKGVDASRKILFGKIHGASDIHLYLNKKSIHIELQRIANSLKPGKKKESEVSVLLKEHKIKNSNVILFITNYKFLSTKLGKKSFYADKIKEIKCNNENEAVLIAVDSRSLKKYKENQFILPKKDEQILIFLISEIEKFIEWLKRMV